MIAAGQATVSCHLVSGQADSAPAAAPTCAGDIYEELPGSPRLEQPSLCNLKTKPNQPTTDVRAESPGFDRKCIERRFGQGLYG